MGVWGSGAVGVEGRASLGHHRLAAVEAGNAAVREAGNALGWEVGNARRSWEMNSLKIWAAGGVFVFLFPLAFTEGSCSEIDSPSKIVSRTISCWDTSVGTSTYVPSASTSSASVETLDIAFEAFNFSLLSICQTSLGNSVVPRGMVLSQELVSELFPRDYRPRHELLEPFVCRTPERYCKALTPYFAKAQLEFLGRMEISHQNRPRPSYTLFRGS
uniref:Uncharacterized protein n=1 Tax=Cannabis sativa TaxID=3483 RepID=A0A803P9D9_CANSA